MTHVYHAAEDKQNGGGLEWCTSSVMCTIAFSYAAKLLSQTVANSSYVPGRQGEKRKKEMVQN